MSNTITSSFTYFNNGGRTRRRSCQFNLLKNIHQPPLSFNFNTKYQISRVVCVQIRASSSSSSAPSSSSPWKKWLWGFLLTVIVPAAGHKGGLLVALKGKIEQAVETVEHVTEVVEEIAEEAEKIVEEVEAKLPGDSKLKEALDSFDHLAKVAINEAKKAEDIIHKPMVSRMTMTTMRNTMKVKKMRMKKRPLFYPQRIKKKIFKPHEPVFAVVRIG